MTTNSGQTYGHETYRHETYPPHVSAESSSSSTFFEPEEPEEFEATEELHTSDIFPAIYANQRPGTSRSSSNPCRQQSDTIDLVSDDDSPIPPHVSALPVSEDNIELIDLVSDSSDE